MKTGPDVKRRFQLRICVARWSIGIRYAVFAALIATSPWDDAMGSDPKSEKSVTVAAYCGCFAKAHAESKTFDVVKDSIRVKARGKAVQRIFNRFQPRGSRFVAGFRCDFAATSSDGTSHKFTVDLYLAETREFAEFTQWEDLQIIPIKRVKETGTERSGYGVFKYLKEE